MRTEDSAARPTGAAASWEQMRSLLPLLLADAASDGIALYPCRTQPQGLWREPEAQEQQGQGPQALQKSFQEQQQAAG